MAIVLNPLSSEDARNKFGPVMVFTGWRAIKVVRTRVTPTNPRSTRQLAVRGILAGVAQGFGALSSANASSWNDYAASQPKSNAFGQFYASGINAYCELNFLVVDCGNVAVATPPVVAFKGNISTFAAVPGTANGDIDVTWVDPATAAATDFCDIWITPLLPNGNVNPNSFGYTHNSYTDVTLETKTISSLVEDGWYGTKGRFVQVDGRTGLFFSALCKAKTGA